MNTIYYDRMTFGNLWSNYEIYSALFDFLINR